MWASRRRVNVNDWVRDMLSKFDWLKNWWMKYLNICDVWLSAGYARTRFALFENPHRTGWRRLISQFAVHLLSYSDWVNEWNIWIYVMSDWVRDMWANWWVNELITWYELMHQILNFARANESIKDIAQIDLRNGVSTNHIKHISQIDEWLSRDERA